MRRANRQKDKKRFKSKIKFSGACWLWKDAPFADGYGRFKLRIGDRFVSVRAHRLSYAWSIGLDSDRQLPKGEVVMHSCDTPLCVRPKHLLPGSVQKNTDDCVSKGRRVYSPGERNGQSKLTLRQVRTICRSKDSLRVLSDRYGISRGHIWRIRTGKRWQSTATN